MAKTIEHWEFRNFNCLVLLTMYLTMTVQSFSVLASLVLSKQGGGLNDPPA